MKTVPILSVLSQLLQESVANLLKDCHQSTLWVANTAQMPISEITIHETATEAVLTAYLADVDMKTLKVEASQETLLIQGQYSESMSVDGYFSPQHFQSLIPLPYAVHPATIQAELKPGVLMIRFPKLGQIEPTRVKVELLSPEFLAAELYPSSEVT